MKMVNRFDIQQGYFLFMAVVFILIIGVMGSLIAYLSANRAMLSVHQQNGLNTFYNAESGLEIVTRYLSRPNLVASPARISCASVAGTAQLTNASLNGGTFTAITTNSSPIFSLDTLSSAITASVLIINVASTAGFAPSGRIMIDREAIDYSGISGNSFIGVTRGTGGTAASSHANGASVSQYQCSLDVQAGIPNLTSPSYKRELQWNVQLEDGWTAGNILSGPTRWNLVHWNIPTEIQWTQVAPAIATPQILNDVSIVSYADAWAVGRQAAALHYNGSTWTNITTGIAGGDTLSSVSAVSSIEAWACATQGKIYKWSGGTSWTNPSTPGNSLNSISVIDSNGNGTGDVGWVVGTKKTAFLYNGSTWASANTGITVDLNGVSTLSSTDAWAAGATGKIFQWTGGASWAVIATPSSTPTLNSISMLRSGSVDIGWAVGTSSTAWYYNGTSWASQNTGLAGGLTLNSVVTVSPNEAWVVASGGQIYEWNGSTWTLIFTSAVGLNGIDILHPKGQPTSVWRQIFH